MADAAPLRATFYTFNKHSERGGVLIGATVVTLLLGAGLVGAFVLVNWPLIQRMGEAISSQDPNAAAAVVGGMFSVFGFIILFLFFYYVLLAAYEAACLRWMLRREAPGLFGINLGADTWRVYFTYWIWFSISLGLSIAVSMVMIPLMFLVMAGSGSSDVNALLSNQIVLQLALSTVQYGIMAFIGVRFAPAAATSIGAKRFAFFDAWKVTRGRFWALFGSFLILWLMFMVVMGLVGLVGFAAVIGALYSSGAFNPAASPAEASAAFASVFTVQNLALIGVFYALMLVLYVFYALMSYGVNARAVIAAVDEGKIEGVTPNVAEVFD